MKNINNGRLKKVKTILFSGNCKEIKHPILQIHNKKIKKKSRKLCCRSPQYITY